MSSPNPTNQIKYQLVPIYIYIYIATSSVASCTRFHFTILFFFFISTSPFYLLIISFTNLIFYQMLINFFSQKIILLFFINHSEVPKQERVYFNLYFKKNNSFILLEVVLYEKSIPRFLRSR